MWSHILGLTFSESMFSLISLAFVLKNVIKMTEKWHWYCVTMFIPFYIFIYPVIYKARLCVSSTRRFFFYMADLFYLRSSTYISNVYNPDQNLIPTSQKICDHMVSDLKLDYTFRFFFVIYLDCILFLVSCGIFQLT